MLFHKIFFQSFGQIGKKNLIRNPKLDKPMVLSTVSPLNPKHSNIDVTQEHCSLLPC
jgi:hypothetical protein